MALAVVAWPIHGTAVPHVADETLSAYIDGELPADERLAVEDHLGDCERCQAVVQAHRRVGVQVRSLVVRPVPPALLHEVRQRLPWH